MVHFQDAFTDLYDDILVMTWTWCMPGEQWILGFIWPKNHSYSISAQSYNFCPRLIQLDILDFTLSHILVFMYFTALIFLCFHCTGLQCTLSVWTSDYAIKAYSVQGTALICFYLHSCNMHICKLGNFMSWRVWGEGGEDLVFKVQTLVNSSKLVPYSNLHARVNKILK